MTLDQIISKYKLSFIGLALVAILSVIPIVIYLSFLQDYRSLDRQDIQNDMERANSVIQERFSLLSTKVNDWGAWDDIFNIVRNPTRHAISSFEKENITQTVFEGLQISFLCLLDKNLRAVMTWTFIDGKLSKSSSSNFNFVVPDYPLIKNSQLDLTKDFVRINNQPAIAVAKTITRADGSGPPSGRIVFGRLIDSSMLEALRRQTRLEIQVENELVNEHAHEQKQIESPLVLPFGIVHLTKEKAFAHIPMVSLTAEVIGYFNVTGSRDILLFGERSSQKIAIILACLLASILLILFLVFRVTGFKKGLHRLLSANKLLKDREAQLQALIDSVPGYVSWFDHHLKYLGVNSKLAEDFGVHPNAFIGKELGWNTYHNFPEMKNELKLFFEGSGFTRQITLEMTIKNEKRFFLLCMEKYRKGHAVVAVGIDISKQKNAEEQAAKDRVLAVHASRLSALGEMAAGIAHEINNPLAIIAGTVQILPKLIQDEQKFSEKCLNIEKSVQRITKIVRSLKKFSRSSENRVFSAKSVRDLIQEAITLTDPKANNNSVKVSIILNTDAQILCDEIEIEQVLVNLINNSIDATKSEKDRWIKISADEDSNNVVVIRVKDSGPGIPAAIRQQLFKPFFTTKVVGEGTGLGLSIVKGILDEHKASIQLDESSQNTCFEIRFAKHNNNTKLA